MRAMTEAVKELKKMYPDVLNMTVDDFHEALKMQKVRKKGLSTLHFLVL